MKLAFFAVALLSAVDATTEYQTYDSVGGGCIGLNKGSVKPRNKLKLLKCVSDNDAIQWRVDELGRFHSKVDDDACMQADGSSRKLKDGMKLRIYPCSDSEFQKFDYNFETAGPIKPVSSPDLCVVRRGVNANIGSDPIILKKCSVLDEDRALGWENDNPDTHGPF